LTKIKIIGDPGKQPVETIKMWLEVALKKFNLLDQQVYLFFIENPEQLKEILQRYTRIIERFSLRGRKLGAKMFFEHVLQTIGYIDESDRQNGVPPIILIKKNAEIFEDDFLDEVAHVREDKNGWIKIELEAFELLFKDYKGIWDISTEWWLFRSLKDKIADFFSSQTISQYGLIKEVFKERERKLNYWVKEHLPKRKGILKGEDFDLGMTVAFWTTLPPSYPQKEDEENLEKIVINHISQMGMEPKYRKIKAIVSQLESPPKVANIYKCGAEIIELALEFLEK